ncbi:MAG: nucleotidyl transferase AbiEii/AbiGii toxin family protein [bacterium]|nr:nucleotidyl transferase AbiEii/AbiGii toxin family protein [bacterium]
MTILSANQQRVLDELTHESTITGAFYLSGGTALAEYYLHHRYSEDLDFFSPDEFTVEGITVALKKIGARAEVSGMRYEQSFNRNLFFLEVGEETIKTEFTYFPFERIDATKKIGALSVDSLLDIAVNKLFTIYQKPRSRDFIDLYCILQQEKNWTVDDLSKKAQIKFDTHIDPLQLGAQFVRADELKDYPRMLTPVEPAVWQDFFRVEVGRLRSSVLES